MIEIVPKTYEDSDYDMCNALTIAVLKMNGMKIALCEECVKDLTESLTKFNNIIFCHQCQHFQIINNSGFLYDQRCIKLDRDVPFMHTCSLAMLKQK